MSPCELFYTSLSYPPLLYDGSACNGEKIYARPYPTASLTSRCTRRFQATRLACDAALAHTRCLALLHTRAAACREAMPTTPQTFYGFIVRISNYHMRSACEDAELHHLVVQQQGLEACRSRWSGVITKILSLHSSKQTLHYGFEFSVKLPIESSHSQDQP